MRGASQKRRPLSLAFKREYQTPLGLHLYVLFQLCVWSSEEDCDSTSYAREPHRLPSLAVRQL